MKFRSSLALPDVTLASVTGVNLKNTLYALWRSKLNIDFFETILITDKDFSSPIKGIKVVKTKGFSLDSIDAYSEYCIYKLHENIRSKFVLLVQADGYVIHHNLWNSKFYDFDYIGAPWRLTPDAYIDPFGNQQRVGNGGFSFRSQKLLKTPLTSKVEWNVNEGEFYKHMNIRSQSEDGIICIHNRHIYESAGNLFAPLEIALGFSCEQKVPEYTGKLTFGFHKTFPLRREKILDVLYRFIFSLRYFRL